MRLLDAHRILVAAALALSLLLGVWGAVHAFGRHEEGAWMGLALGLGAAPVLAWYLRKLYRNPPL